MILADIPAGVVYGQEAECQLGSASACPRRSEFIFKTFNVVGEMPHDKHQV
jgi:hypothetical protein